MNVRALRSAPAAGEPPLLTLHVEGKRFGRHLVLGNISLDVREGEFVSVVGASGCGKSTLLRVMAGLDRDFDGTVTIGGQPVSGPTRHVRFVFQEPRLFPWLTVADNICFDRQQGGPHGSRAAEVAARVALLLAEVGLVGLEGRLPKELSGGQAQRVAIARGLFVEPRVLLLDEPFSAVDAFTRLRLQELLLKVARRHGVTVVLVTHDVDEAVVLSDRVLVLEANPGRLAAEIAVGLPHPRDRDHPLTAAAISRVRAALSEAHAI